MALRKATTTDAPKVNEQAQDVQEQEAQTQASTVETVAEQREEAQAKEATVVETQPEPEAELEPAGAEGGAEQAEAPAEDPVAEEAEAAQEVQPEQKQVAVKTESAPPAIAGNAGKGGAMVAFTNDMAEHGFEGLNVTGMSFDRIKLHEGRFKLGTDEKDLGESFDCVLMGTRPIYIVRQYDGDDSPVYFSYDEKGELLTDGSPAAELQAEWIEQGYPQDEWDIKRYIEGMATLTNREDEYQDHMVSLSIPPASTDRLGGAAAVGWQKYRLRPDALITRCKVGPSIKKGNTTWRPWLFTCVGKVEA